MKVLIVDDSIVFRSAITLALQEIPEFVIHKSVSNGQLAVEQIRENPDIDMITLDMEMPIMDGMETVKEIRTFNKNVKIIIFASPTTSGAERTIEVLNLGANDFVAKVAGNGTIDQSVQMIADNLVPKMRALVDAPIQKQKIRETISRANVNLEESNAFFEVDHILRAIASRPDLIVMTSSTGGPVALTNFFKKIESEVPIPMLLVQHMPPIFTTKLADALSLLSPVSIVEAEEGSRLKNGVCYLAPGDYHMTLNQDLTVSLNQNEKVCYVRPSADVLFESVYKNYSGKVLTIVFTGMGSDGMQGCKLLKNNNVDIVVQDEESSVVWGMPGSVVREGMNPHILPLDKLSELINKIIKL